MNIGAEPSERVQNELESLVESLTCGDCLLADVNLDVAVVLLTL